MNSKFKNAIVDVKNSGLGRLAVFTNSASSANSTLNSKSFEDKGLKASIPSYFVTSQGVIKNVPLDLSGQELLENIEILDNHHFNSSVLEVRRLPRKTFNKDTNKTEYVPSHTILLTFKGRSLPSKIAIYHASIVVEPYTPPVKICWNCLQYGHISKYCKSKKKCKKCGDPDHDESNPCPSTDKNPKCIHCNGPHFPNSSTCPEHIFQKDFRSYAINNCLTFS